MTTLRAVSERPCRNALVELSCPVLETLASTWQLALATPPADRKDSCAVPVNAYRGYLSQCSVHGLSCWRTLGNDVACESELSPDCERTAQKRATPLLCEGASATCAVAAQTAGSDECQDPLLCVWSALSSSAAVTASFLRRSSRHGSCVVWLACASCLAACPTVETLPRGESW